MFDGLIQQFSGALVILEFILGLFIYWAPFVFGFVLWNMWRRFLLRKYLSNMKWSMIEIKIPKDIKKTPLAMEVVLAAFYQKSTGPWTDQLFKGRVRDWFSLEIVSIEGSIHFFMRMPSAYKNFIEAHIYAQYPSAEVYEVSDYARRIDYRDKNSSWQPWGLEYILTEEDPLPIATYKDFGLDKEGVKEEEKVDPLASMLETLGSCGKGEQMWLQIMIQFSGDRYHKPGTRNKKQNWVAEGQKIIKEIEDKYKKSGGAASDLQMTLSDKAKIQAISRNISKIGFDTGIRGMYWVHKDAEFDVSKVKGVLGLFALFRLDSFNGFKTNNETGFGYPWQDVMGIRVQGLKQNLFNAYKRREYFYPKGKFKPFVLNSEELATIYHFPGMVAETPTFGRIESRRGEPPTNLPI